MSDTWSDEQTKAAALLFAMGVGAERIGQLVGKSRTTVSVKMKRSGVARYCRSKMKRYAEDFQIITYRKAGMEWAAIARKMGMSKNVPHDRVRAIKRRIKGEKKSEKQPSKDTSAPKSDKQKMRPCMFCRKEFLSSWPGDRYCGPCRNSHAFRDANGSIEAQYG